MSALYVQRKGMRFIDMPKLARTSQGKFLPLVTLSEAVSLSLSAVSQDTIIAWATKWFWEFCGRGQICRE